MLIQRSDLICGLLTISPEDRLTLEQAARHPWLQRCAGRRRRR